MHDTDSLQQLVHKTAAHMGVFSPPKLVHTTSDPPPNDASTLKTLFRKGSRHDMLAQGLGHILPEFHTNHRDEQGISSSINDPSASLVLSDVLKQLHSTRLHDPPRLSTASSKPLTGLERIQNEYAIERTVGEGSFGKVKLGIHIVTGKKVAIKCLEKSVLTKNVGSSERLLREIVLLSHLNHPYICKLLQVMDSPHTIFLIMEYEQGGELYDYIVKCKRTSEDTARHFFRQMVCAINYCHTLGIVHRDLKPENMMLDEFGNIKLIDFGFANVVRENKTLETFCGSAAYAAPEMIGNKKYHGCETDVWALGVILYVLVCGEIPFDDKHLSRMYVAIMSGKYKSIPDHVSPECKDLITSILKVKPQERATLHTIRSHPWTTQQGHLPLIHFCETTPCVECNMGLTDEQVTEWTNQLQALGYTLSESEQALSNQYPSSAFAALCLLSKSEERVKSVMSRLGVLDDGFASQWKVTCCSTRVDSNPVTHVVSPEAVTQTVSSDSINPPNSSNRIIQEESEEHTPQMDDRHVRAGSALRKVVQRRQNLELAADALLAKINEKKQTESSPCFDI